MVQYREFTPQVERQEAVATWPLVHKAAVETGFASPEEAMPQGDYLAHQRIARDRMGLGELAAKAIQEAPLTRHVVVPEANEPRAMPSSDRLVAALGQRVQAAKIEREAGIRHDPADLPPIEPIPGVRPPQRVSPQPAMTRMPADLLAPQAPSAYVPSAPLTPRSRAEAELAAEREIAASEPAMSGFDESRPTAASVSPYAGAGRQQRMATPPLSANERPAPYPAPDRGGLFGGEYRGRDREARQTARVADRQDRSLGAVFTRLSGQRDSLPDPRSRGRTSPGLGSVFNRLR